MVVSSLSTQYKTFRRINSPDVSVHTCLEILLNQHTNLPLFLFKFHSKSIVFRKYFILLLQKFYSYSSFFLKIFYARDNTPVYLQTRFIQYWNYNLKKHTKHPLSCTTKKKTEKSYLLLYGKIIQSKYRHTYIFNNVI